MSDASVDELWAAPPEILALVFRFLSHELPVTPHHAPYHADFADHQEPNMRSTWVKVTHVSKYWREVALSDTSLWTNISTAHSVAWAKALLERSGRRSVSLYLGECASGKVDDPVWKEAASRAHTIQIGSSSKRFEWQERLLDIDARSLVTFCIQLHHKNEERYFEEERCPSRFFKSISNEFRELELCGFFTYSFSFISLHPGLSSLKMGLLSDDHWTDVGPIGLLLNALSQLQQLRELTLLGFNAKNIDAFITDQYVDSVRLPHLQHMHLEDCGARTLLALFNAIVVLPDAKVRLISHSVDWNKTSGPGEFTTVFERRLSTRPWHELQAVAISPIEHSSNYIQLSNPTDRSCFAVSAWRANPDDHDIFRNWNRGFVPKVEPDLYLILPKQHAEIGDCPYKISRMLGQSSVRTLFLTLDRALLAWNTAQTHFPALRHILLRESTAEQAISLMHADCQEYLRAQSPLRHPELERLTILGDNVNWEQEMAVEDTEGVAPCTLAQLLERIHRIRTDSGLPVDIFVDQHNLSRGAFKTMSDVSFLKVLPLY